MHTVQTFRITSGTYKHNSYSPEKYRLRKCGEFQSSKESSKGFFLGFKLRRQHMALFVHNPPHTTFLAASSATPSDIPMSRSAFAASFLDLRSFRISATAAAFLGI